MRRVARAAAALLALGLLASLAACGDGSPANGSDRASGGRRAGATIARTVDSAVFTVDCDFSHRALDDPIVFPGRPGASHLHDFFGAVDVDAGSTAESLRDGDTTCEDREDTASYWAPALLHGDEPVDPIKLRAYYRAAPGADAAEVRSLPAGLEMIVGDMHTPEGEWPDLAQVAWGCGLRPRQFHHMPPDDCTPRSPLTLRLVMPDCWDGKNLASPDHHAHLAASDDGRCPASHPVPILQVQLSYQYPVWAATPDAPSPHVDDLTLASGGWQTSHGDLLNAWDQERLDRHTALCVHAMANCTIG